MTLMLTAVVESLARTYARIAPMGRGTFHVAKVARAARPRSRWRDSYATPGGVTLDLDIATYPDLCMAYGLYELDTARLIRRLLRPGDHFVDAGANIGYFTTLAARCVGDAGRVDAFEPQPDNRVRLVTHIHRNGVASLVRVHAVALSDRAGEVTIHSTNEPSRNHGESSLFPIPGVKSIVHTVPSARMDELLAGTTPQLVKIDVEGAEPLVIEGMHGLVTTEQPPAIIMEHNVPSLAAAGCAPDEAVRRLMEMQPRYRVLRVGARLTPIGTDAATLAATPQVNLLFTTDPIH